MIQMWLDCANSSRLEENDSRGKPKLKLVIKFLQLEIWPKYVSFHLLLLALIARLPASFLVGPPKNKMSFYQSN